MTKLSSKDEEEEEEVVSEDRNNKEMINTKDPTTRSLVHPKLEDPIRKNR